MNDLIGEVIWAFVKGADAIPAIEIAAREGRVGGVWLLREQMTGPGATARLVNRLQGASRLPLLVGVDAEAGMGHVMEGATELPRAMAIGAAGDPRLSFEAATVTAKEAAACGINAVCVPVLDVNTNGANPIINVRSFGGSPDLVAAMGAAYIGGARQAAHPPRGVLSIGKHFPGHGETSRDSHLELPTLDAPRSRVDEIDLPPFRAAIAADVPMLMTAHVAYPALDPSGAPATLSHPILTDLLRGELGFRGALATDALDMYSIAHNVHAGDAAVAALLAGNDFLLTDRPDIVHAALLQALQDGRVPEDRLREAAGRARAAKRLILGPELRHPEPLDPDEADRTVGTAGHEEIADRIAAASITLVDGALRRPPERPLLLATQMQGWPRLAVEPRLREALAAVSRPDAELLVLDSAPGPDQLREAVARARAAGWAALLHFNGVMSYRPGAVEASDESVALAERIAESGVPLSVASMGSPYVLTRFPRASARLCAYSACKASLRATLRVLMGEAAAPGRLPVRLEGRESVPADV